MNRIMNSKANGRKSELNAQIKGLDLMCQLRPAKLEKAKPATATENDDGKLNYHPARTAIAIHSSLLD